MMIVVIIAVIISAMIIVFIMRIQFLAFLSISLRLVGLLPSRLSTTPVTSISGWASRSSCLTVGLRSATKRIQLGSIKIRELH